MGIFSWIVVGGLAGWLAGKVMDTHYGLMKNIGIGILGGFLGGLITSLLGFGGLTGINFWSILVSILGSCLLLFIVKKAKK